jgi:hypothetical protein
MEANPVRGRLVGEAAEFPFSSAFLKDAIDPATSHLRQRSQG